MRVTTPEVTGPAESLADLLAEVGAYRGALAPAVASVGAPSRTRARASAAGTVTDRPVTETALLQKSTGNFAAAVLVALVAARASFLAAWLLGLVRIPDGSEVGCPPSPEHRLGQDWSSASSSRTSAASLVRPRSSSRQAARVR